MTKTRPAVVVNADSVGVLPVKVVVPVTEWQEHFARSPWHVKLEPASGNGLEKTSAADVLQLKSTALERFTTRAGRLSAADLEEIVLAIAAVIELH